MCGEPACKSEKKAIFKGGPYHSETCKFFCSKKLGSINIPQTASNKLRANRKINTFKRVFII